MKTFHICTIVNNVEQYQEMLSSFVHAGFDETCCRFSFFDNCSTNTYEGYSTFNCVMENTEEPYIIYCHQDILLDQGHGYNELLNIVRNLDREDPTWAVLGNAGVTEDHRLVRRLHDPFGNDCGDDTLPIRVCSLDENFLIIKTTSNIRCSAGLKGFHLYATDLCLQATQAQFDCYVVSFHLTHLSRGRVDQAFQPACENFQKQWSRQFRFRYVQTACTTIFLSRNRAFRLFFSSHRVMHWLFSSPLRHKIICRLSDRSYET